jgi:histidinol-phosphate aminotransferase
MKMVERIARKELSGIEPYLSDRDITEEEGMRFADLNENARDLFGGGLNRYPDPLAGKLSQKIAAYCNVKQSRVQLFNGSDEAIDLLIRVFCSPGKDSAIILGPTYSMYRICAEANGVEAISVPLDGNFQPDADAVLEAARKKRAKLIFACSPNNPTGNMLDFGILERIAKEAEAVLVVDEAYAEFSGRSFAGRAKKFQNAVVLRTFSKAWALAGARLGYCIASPEVISLIRKVKLPYSINSLSQQAALAAFGKKGIVRRYAQETVRERERLSSGLAAFGMRVYPSDANFLLFSPPDGMDAKKIQKKMAKESKILVRDRTGVVKNALRVTVCTRQENDYFLRSLAKASIDAVLLDIDGTLVDVSRSYSEAVRLTAQKISGKRVAPKLVARVKAMPSMNNDWDATVEVLRRLGVMASRREIVPIFQEIYFGKGGSGLIRNELPLVDLRLLQRLGRKTAIVTGRPRNEALCAARMLGLGGRVPIIAMEDTKRGKPDPAPVLLAIKALGARLPVYIGDSPDDYKAARQAGCAFVAIGRGRAKEGELARFASANDAIRGLFI